jgi:predicted permease
LGAALPPGEFESNPDAAVISYGLWQRLLGGKADVLGDEITLDGRANTIVGVMPAGFALPRQAEVWKPLLVERVTDNRETNSFATIGRLKPGVSLEQAQANMRDVSVAIGQDYPSPCNWSTDLITLQEEAVGGMRTPLFILFGAVGLVLLITCANLANLLLARANARRGEMVVRAALGAGRWRLIRQSLTECLVLAFLGGCLGVIMSFWGTDLLMGLSPDNLPRSDQVHVNGRVLAFALILTPCVAILFGLVPALRESTVELTETLKEGGRTSIGRAGSRIRAGLVVTEIALSLMLLVGAGLLIKSFHRLRRVNPGVDVEHILTMRVALPSLHYSEDHQVKEFYRSLPERIGAIPGVASVGSTTSAPILGRTRSFGVRPEADLLALGDSIRSPADFQWVSHNYHRVVNQPLEEGRLFNDGDQMESAPVAIINRTMARTYWGNESPIGQGFSYFSNDNVARVVGVVSDVKRHGLDEPAPSEAYLPFSQSTGGLSRLIVVRSAHNSTLIANAVRNQVNALDRRVPVFNVQSMETIISDSVSRTRFTTLLLSLFASAAALLAAVGIYGVISHYVGQKTREIGLRIALGATPSQILVQVLRQGSTLILLGVTVGLAGAWALSRVLAGLLFGVSATDPTTFAAVAGLSAAVALAATYIPARRATRIDPMVALRYE